MNLGVFLPNWIGDVAMATPALRALRSHFADARIVGIARPYVADVLAGTAWLDDLLFYDPRSRDRRRRGLRFLRRLRAERLDTVVLLTNSFRTAVLARLSGAARRVGFARDGRGWLLTDRVSPYRVRGRFVPTPVLDDYLRLAYAAGCPAESHRIELSTLPADEAAADRAWNRLGLAVNEPVVAFNTGGAFGAAKLWPIEHFAALALRIVGELDHSVLVICGPQEREAADSILRLANSPRVNSLAGEPPSIGLSKACIKRSRLLVTTDSGPRHFATAFRVPLVTLFGPTHIAWSETHDPRAIHVQLAVPCGPCQQRVCPLEHHRCMRELTVDTVFAAVSRQLADGDGLERPRYVIARCEA